jgi:hypothetical protein
MRIMWALFFLGSLAYCSNLIIKSFIDFFQYKTSISMTRVQELPTTFPAVTICNLNPFNEKYANEYIQSTYTLSNFQYIDCFNLTNGTEFNDCVNSTNTNSIIDSFVDNLNRVIANDKNISEYDHYYYGYDLDIDMLVSCEFNSKKCTSDDFSQFWSNEFGNCYIFNDGKKGPLRKTSETGNYYGLKLELVVSK